MQAFLQFDTFTIGRDMDQYYNAVPEGLYVYTTWMLVDEQSRAADPGDGNLAPHGGWIRLEHGDTPDNLRDKATQNVRTLTSNPSLKVTFFDSKGLL